ncbi:MAG: GGDEF domain-containing protein [Oscillospiraceae bacterium]|nr:GGDEF domain-containing protein [Oscillospiraceae bacterium]
MKQEKSKRIALCTCKIQDETIGALVNEICHEANKSGYHVVIYNSFYDFYQDNQISQSSKSIFSLMDYKTPVGIIILGETFQEKDDVTIRDIARKGNEAGIPVVSVDKEIEGARSVLFDYSTSFEQIVRHIVEFHGCKRVDFLGGFKDNPFSDERLNVYKKVMAENGLPIEDFRIDYGDFWDFPAAKAVNGFLAAEKEPPEAIICANDTMAITACRVLEEHGYSVPEDVIVTGFDGIEQEKYHSPRFTTAHQNLVSAAKAAVELIHSSCCGREDVPQKALIPYDVTFSQSCGCQPIEYKKVNNVLMDLYEKLHQRDELVVSMNFMNNTLTACSSVMEALPKIERYIGVLYSDAININFRKSFLSNDISADFGRPIEVGEDMIHVISYLGTHPKEEMKRFSFGERPPYMEHEENIQPDRAIMVIPLNYQEKIFGYLSIHYCADVLRYDTLYKFSMNFNHSLDTVKNKELMLTVNSVLEGANRKLEYAYAHDSMTGLLNRRGFYQKLMEQFGSYEKGYVFVASVDMDGLKYINDNFGHHEGDFAIKQIAGALIKCSGESGICARFGGDEFMSVIFSERKDDPIFTGFKERMTGEIDDINKKYQRDYTIDASYGTQISELSEEIDLDMIMRNADEKMYESKMSRGVKIRKSKRE